MTTIPLTTNIDEVADLAAQLADLAGTADSPLDAAAALATAGALVADETEAPDEFMQVLHDNVVELAQARAATEEPEQSWQELYDEGKRLAVNLLLAGDLESAKLVFDINEGVVRPRLEA